MNQVQQLPDDPFFWNEAMEALTHDTNKLNECHDYEIGADNIMLTDREIFYNVVNQFNFLKPLWDQAKHEIRLEAFENRLGTMSTGEKYLACFMANIWFHENRYDFSLIDAMGRLDGPFRRPIVDWVKNPYWP